MQCCTCSFRTAPRIRKAESPNGFAKRIRKTDAFIGCATRDRKTDALYGFAQRILKTDSRKQMRETDARNGFLRVINIRHTNPTALAMSCRARYSCMVCCGGCCSRYLAVRCVVCLFSPATAVRCILVFFYSETMRTSWPRMRRRCPSSTKRWRPRRRNVARCVQWGAPDSAG